MEGKRGWLFASGEGGAVIFMTVLKATRNWRPERFCGNTCEDVNSHHQYMIGKTYCKKVIDVVWQMFSRYLRTSRRCEHRENDAVRGLKDLQEAIVPSFRKVW